MRQSRYYNYALFLASFLSFLLGISLPIFSLEKFFLLKDSFSLLIGIYQLWVQNEYFLSLILCVFSIVIPLYKFFLYWRIVSVDRSGAYRLMMVNRLLMIGKWSMADVFLIAILAATLKLGGLASVSAHSGLLFFGFSVLSGLWLTHRLLGDYQLVLKK